MWCSAAATLPAWATRHALPDTGAQRASTRTFGEDADYQGPGPALRDEGDGTVTDRVSGLIWQQVDGGEMSWPQAQAYAKTLNLAGHTDWRLPNSLELFSIQDHGRQRPSLDTRFFPDSGAEYWWSGATLAGDASRVWVTNAGGGLGAHPLRESLSAGGNKRFHVRCVRGPSPFSSGPRLRLLETGDLIDDNTGLIWQQAASAAAMNWEAALAWCENLTLAGSDDWRLPNIKELRSLVDEGRLRPAVDTRLLPQMAALPYWSSTPLGNRPERAWQVDFASGLVTYSDKTEPLRVLAVRDEGGSVAGIRDKPVPPAQEQRRNDRGERS
ncbi:hypothetical protein GCM10025770_24490 [Viridibacterium curvum]|uniref:Lcl C-terminal domain-containing protein n=1 Tax=Viridibacterium curvum TaxID=1101404 RepID=A0ABP9QTL0_9RHOO